jgi:transposase
MKFKALQMKRRFITGKTVVGIDPAKQRHQAAILDADGLQIGNPFSFSHDVQGFTEKLWGKLRQYLGESNPGNLVFAIETSCNLWQVLAHYVTVEGFKVVLVSPLTTRRSRPFFNHDFSHTDPKDALLIGSNARDGYFDFYRTFSAEIDAMHQLSLTYCKLARNYVQQRTRLRALLDQVFPEFPAILPLSTKSARYVLSKDILPKDFLAMDVAKETVVLEKISGKQHGEETFLALQQAARSSIGIPKQGPEIPVLRVILDSWLALLKTTEEQMQTVMAELLPLVQETPCFEIITSLKGISDKLAALFIAETRDLSLFKHYKQLEKLSGYNLRQRESGQYVGARHISHIGNRRLSWILYKMAEETAKYVPEVRIKYLRRQLKRRSYRNNIVASAPTLLKLLMALMKNNQKYVHRPEALAEVEVLEERYFELYPKKRAKLNVAAQSVLC